MQPISQQFLRKRNSWQPTEWNADNSHPLGQLLQTFLFSVLRPTSSVWINTKVSWTATYWPNLVPIFQETCTSHRWSQTFRRHVISIGAVIASRAKPRATRHLWSRILRVKVLESSSKTEELIVMPFSGAKAKLKRYSSPKPQKSCSLYQLTRRLGWVCGCSTHVSEFYFRRQKTLYTPKLAKSYCISFFSLFSLLIQRKSEDPCRSLGGWETQNSPKRISCS